MRPPNYNNRPSIFWRPFSRHLLNNNRQPLYRFRRLLLLQFSSTWALYVALSSLILPLRQRIRPFTANKTLSGPPLHRDRPFIPSAPPPRSEVRGWSEPAVSMTHSQTSWSGRTVDWIWERDASSHSKVSWDKVPQKLNYLFSWLRVDCGRQK